MTAAVPREFDLSGKVVFLTGAAGLIGTEIADAYAAYGATVVVSDVVSREQLDAQAAALREAHGGNALGVVCDVTSDESVDRAFTAVEAAFGAVDVLVNNAAIDAKFDAGTARLNPARFEGYPLALFESSVAVNLTGLLRVTQRALPPMLTRRRGVIINVSSLYGLLSPDQGLYDFGEGTQTYKPIDYVATKAAVVNVTRYLATLYANEGIRCNAIAPQGIENDHAEPFRKNFAARSPIGRLARVEEMRGPFVFLAAEASSYVTGATLVVDGGWSAW